MTARARTAGELSTRVQAIQLQAQHLVHTLYSGTHGLRRAGAGEAFWQYRPYSPGDDARRIDWRRTARSNRTLVREHEHHVPTRLLIWRDPTARMDWSSAPKQPQKGFVADVLALALATVAARGGERIGALVHPLVLHSGTAAPDHILSDLNHMAATPPLPPRGSHLLILTDGLDGGDLWNTWLRRVQVLEPRGVIVLIRDAAELEFPYQGDLLFAGRGADETLRLSRAEAARADYLERVAILTSEIISTSTRAGLITITINSHAPLAASFMRLCQMVGQIR